MNNFRILLASLSTGLVLMNCTQAVQPKAEAPLVSTPDAKITATVYNSGFEHAHDTYNGLSSASDGKIYYVLCSTLMDVAGQMYCTVLIQRQGKLNILETLLRYAVRRT